MHVALLVIQQPYLDEVKDATPTSFQAKWIMVNNKEEYDTYLALSFEEMQLELEDGEDAEMLVTLQSGNPVDIKFTKGNPKEVGLEDGDFVNTLWATHVKSILKYMAAHA